MEIGDIVQGVIVKVQKTHAIVQLEDDYQGMLHITGASDYFVTSLNSMFKEQGEYNFKIIEIDDSTKRVKLDWKSIHPRFRKNPFKYVIKETESGSINLKANTEKEVEND